MGSNQTKTEPVIASNDIKLDPRNVPFTEEEYPPPYVPDSHRGEPEDTDFKRDTLKRIANISATASATYSGLLQYLSEGAETETQHVTAIYYWMKSQDYDDPSLDTTQSGTQSRAQPRAQPRSQAQSEDTPRGYMKIIRDGEGDLTTFFTILCRRSMIPCVIIEGIGKDEHYTIGVPELDMASRWNAVFVDGEWRLIHIEWAIEGGRDPNQNSFAQESSDYFFMVDPQDFSYICLPDNHRWQLLGKPLTKKQFLAYPTVRRRFFELDMSIVAPTTSRTKAPNGRLTIELACPKTTGEKLKLRYSLTKCIQSTEAGSQSKQKRGKLNRFVFVNRKPTRILFEMLLPEPGKYTFDVFSCEDVKGNERDNKSKDDPGRNKGATDSEYDLNGTTSGTQKPENIQDIEESLCQFRIISEKVWNPEELEPLPECPDTGWGPGPECRELGLKPLTHIESYIFIRPHDKREIRFRKTKNLEVQCKLSHNFLPVYDLVEQVSCTDEAREASIYVELQEEGTYALTVYCREPGTREYHEACCYLLKQQTKSRLPENYAKGHRRKYRDKMLRSRLEYHLDHHTSEQELLDALEVFECYNCPDNGERTRAHTKVKQYWEVKRELEGATMGRNKTALKKWIDRAKRSPYRRDLEALLQKAEAIEGRVVKQGYVHPVAKMDQHTITEIHNYKHPPPVVHDVMTSTFILLGEDKQYLEDWIEIQYLMGKQGKDSLQKRIIARTPDDVTLAEVDDAENVIEPYNLEKCRTVSTGVATFYRWCKNFSHDARQKYMAEEEKQKTQESLAGRETFRDPENNEQSPRTSESKGSKRGSPKEDGHSRGNSAVFHENSRKSSPAASRNNSTAAEKDKHPFGVSNENEVPRQKFFSETPITKDKTKQPVSYAGFKPYDYDD